MKRQDLDVPCSSRAAEGLVRGGLIGFSWGLSVDRVERQLMREAQEQAGAVVTSSFPTGTAIRQTIVGTSKSMLGFGAFVG
jgi:hypothetical protein